MKRSAILNQDLNEVIAGMGHGDWLLVVDAGFPIPNHVRRIDLALQKDDPDVETVLRLIAGDFIAEKVYYASEVPTYNKPLMEKVHAIFDCSVFDTLPHKQILTEAANKAKAIVRTGAFDPYGNIILQSGVDAPQWFSKPGLVVPNEYKDKV
ncbi:ribose pyranase [Cohnella kolymensis]|uniref:D-ribose pyranase n=1 Tax=Cohnella kolymensis TaxID=1590652 RepID=A0ABR5A0J6_9BACL|nr:D-ribose pyranase [Cohnella kolymensis]KIL34561.1 ribose pyranase [Cohnella kolymensis]